MVPSVSVIINIAAARGALPLRMHDTEPQLALQDLGDTLGTKPCDLCRATHPRDCQWAYMHCNAPSGLEAARRTHYARVGNYWRFTTVFDACAEDDIENEPL